MIIHIKNMVCPRCKMAVESILTTSGYTIEAVDLGEARILETLSEMQLSDLQVKFRAIGFDLLSTKKDQQIAKIKGLLMDLVQNKDALLPTSLSVYISENMGQEYSGLSQVFSQSEFTTIEQYFILLKIERVKELLAYDEHSLKEIAFKLNYSSVAHLSTQFKKVTGSTPTAYKDNIVSNR